MRAKITFYIGLFVTILGVVQFATSLSAMRLITVFVGVFFMVFGWKVGWTRYPVLTTWLGHAAVAAGCLVSAYGVYQVPFMKAPPSLIAVLDLPLFWGLFTLFGGYCMITHSYCACCIRRSAESRGSVGAGLSGSDTSRAA